MDVTLHIRLDLGECSIEEGQRDADSLVLAVLDALGWRGRIVYLYGDATPPDHTAWTAVLSEVTNYKLTVRHDRRRVDLAGVEWGGK